MLSPRADVGAIPDVLASVTVPASPESVPFPLPPWHIIRRWSRPRGVGARVGHSRRRRNHRPSEGTIVVVS